MQPLALTLQLPELDQRLALQCVNLSLHSPLVLPASSFQGYCQPVYSCTYLLRLHARISQHQAPTRLWTYGMGRKQCKPLLPSRAVAPLVILAGILDAIGNTWFVLAAHSGRLDVAAILSSLYPAATVGLSVLVLRERVIRIQAIGILLVLLAVPLISA